MKGFPIEGSDTLSFARKGRQDFSIFEGEAEIIALPREIGRRIYFALRVENRIPRDIGVMTPLFSAILKRRIDFNNLRPSSRRLVQFRLNSNCFGTSSELLNGAGRMNKNPWSVLAEASDVYDDNLRGAYLSRYAEMGSFERLFFKKTLMSKGFPLFVFDKTYDREHSAVILGKDNAGKYIVFEKAGIEYAPFRISIKGLDWVKTFQYFASYLQK